MSEYPGENGAVVREQIRNINARLDEAFRRIERNEVRVEAIPSVTMRIESLSQDIHALAEKVDAMVTNAGVNRRGEWGLVVQIIAFVTMGAIAAGSFLVTVISRGVR